MAQLAKFESTPVDLAGEPDAVRLVDKAEGIAERIIAARASTIEGMRAKSTPSDTMPRLGEPRPPTA